MLDQSIDELFVLLAFHLMLTQLEFGIAVE